jgi:hypothetical protein
MKRKAEIRVAATFVVTADLTDAKWKKLIGDYFEPSEGSWKDEHPTCIETWAEEQVTDALRVEIDNLMPASIQLNHIADNSDGKEKFQVEEVDLDYDGIEISDSE